MRKLRWTIDVTGWRYTRRWVFGIRRGERWIGARRNFACDWWEFGIFGLTVAIPDERQPRQPAEPPANAFHVPVGADWCPRCGDTNYDEASRTCITCAHGDDAYRGGEFRNGRSPNLAPNALDAELPTSTEGEPVSLLDRIDRASAGLCPCGAEPSGGSAYCSDDCRPTIHGRDTQPASVTEMRWRPDLVTAAPDDGLTSLGGRVRSGQFWREQFEREDGSLHLRVDDGHRFVGADILADANHERCNEVWARLERELTDARRVEPESNRYGWIATYAGLHEMIGHTASVRRHRGGEDGAPVHEYRRLCRCGRQAVPLLIRSPDSAEEWNACPGCGHRFPGPPRVAEVRRVSDPPAMELRLESGDQWTNLRVDECAQWLDGDAAFRRAWRELDHYMDRALGVSDPQIPLVVGELAPRAVREGETVTMLLA